MKKESEKRIDDALDNYFENNKKEEKNLENIIHNSDNKLYYNENSSNNNHGEINTNGNIKNNNYICCNSISNNNNYYYLHSANYNSCCGYYTKSSDNFSNDNNNNNTQKFSISLLKKKNNNKNKLKIKSVFGKLFKENFVITINEYGIENFAPLRRQYDGITKFGPIGYDNEGKPINDFQIVISDEIKNDIETLFMIEYNTIKKKYFLIPNYLEEDQNLNLFIKIDHFFPIYQKHKFSLGDVHFSVEPKPGGALELEMNTENGEIESYLFGIAKELVKIGRSKENDIILKNLAYSRIQTSLIYKEEENVWYIQDGFEEKRSMNGTWLYINFPFEISYDTKLRVGNNLLELNIT